MRILLADDHAVVRRGLRALLEQRAGWQVCAEAANGREAVELAMRHFPDVAILDMAMPELNGLEATRGIRRHSPNTEILLFTVIESRSLLRDVLAAGARGFVLKGEVERSIMDAVEALAAHRPYFSGALSNEVLDGYLRDATARAAAPDGLLTPREQEIAQRVVEGLSTKQIALNLGISTKTVETHRTALMRKIGAHSVADVVRYAIKTKSDRFDLA
jgi:DNA-binding NarL/FixJ family response regulator